VSFTYWVNLSIVEGGCLDARNRYKLKKSLLRSKSALIGISGLDFASFSNGKKKEKKKCYHTFFAPN